MAMIPASHVTEQSGDISFPWVIRCQRCGKEVCRIDSSELASMVATDEVEPVICFDCEEDNLMRGGDVPVKKTYNARAPFPCISVPKRLLGLV